VLLNLFILLQETAMNFKIAAVVVGIVAATAGTAVIINRLIKGRQLNTPKGVKEGNLPKSIKDTVRSKPVVVETTEPVVTMEPTAEVQAVVASLELVCQVMSAEGPRDEKAINAAIDNATSLIMAAAEKSGTLDQADVDALGDALKNLSPEEQQSFARGVADTSDQLTTNGLPIVGPVDHEDGEPMDADTLQAIEEVGKLFDRNCVRRLDDSFIGHIEKRVTSFADLPALFQSRPSN
jgi:hypothetical protein